MIDYNITVESDSGKFTFSGTATDMDTAKLIVMKSEGCPETSIIKAEEIKRIKPQNTELTEFAELAQRAHRLTSFSPEKRGEQLIKDYTEQLKKDEETLLKNDVAPEKINAYIFAYKKHFSAWLHAKSRCSSTMIVGPANYPTRRAEKANRSERNKYDFWQDWRVRAINAMTRTPKPPKVRTEKGRKQLFKSENFEAVANYDLDRLQIFSPSKPSVEHIAQLKRNAFKWSPRNQCWQRILTTNAVAVTKQFFLEIERLPKWYKSKLFSKRDYEVTQIVFCNGTPPDFENWEECKPEEVNKTSCTHLHTIDGTKFYGWL